MQHPSRNSGSRVVLFVGRGGSNVLRSEMYSDYNVMNVFEKLRIFSSLSGKSLASFKWLAL